MVWSQKKKQHKQRKQSKVPSAPKAMLYRQIIIGVILTLLLAGVFYAVWYLTRLPAFTISNIEVASSETISTVAARGLVESELEGAYYRLIPKSFTYMYPHEVITESLSNIPRIKEITLEREGRNTLSLSYSEYVPEALWCTGIQSESCVFIDDSGYAFALAPQLTGGAFVRYVEPEAPAVGERVHTIEYVAGTRALAKALSFELSLRVVEIARDEEDVMYRLALGGEIRTTLMMSYEETLQNLQTILESDEFAHLEPGAFRYIDLRFGNKVFVHEGLEGEMATSTEEVIE